MIFVRRVIVLIVTAFILFSILQLRQHHHERFQDQTDARLKEDRLENGHTSSLHRKPLQDTNTNNTLKSPFSSTGKLKDAKTDYTRGLVIGRTTKENTTWLDDYLVMNRGNLQTYLYIVDDDSAPLHTPMNKGNEAMVYLTYILDHYEDLPDISIFMHPHQKAWHTPELLNHDAAEVLQRLNPERVVREGYMNLRCYWDPGCPEHVYPDKTLRTSQKREEIAIAAAWEELFPGESIPEALGAPCCAQFAVAKHRIQAIPKENFHRYRNWLIKTSETNWTSGRVFEYLWQKLFTGQNKFCPADARVCYCDAYAVCFSTSETFEDWFDNHHWWREAMTNLDKWNAQADLIKKLGTWKEIEALDIDVPIPGRNIELKKEMDTRFERLTRTRFEAIKNGTNAEIRRQVTGS